MCQEKISIIIPVYNTERYLERCVQSVLAQTYRNIEVILVDDGSPDNAGALCQELRKQDDRILVIHKENGGLSSARNAGLCAATGDYIGFVDSDDWVEPDMYMHLYNIAVQYSAAVVRCGIQRDAEFCIGTENETEAVEILTTAEAAKTVWENGFICNKLYRSTLFLQEPQIRFDERIRYIEDEPALLRCLIKSEGMVITNWVGYHYYMNQEGLVKSNFNLSKLTSLIGFKDMCNTVEDHIPELYDYFLSHYFAVCIGFYRYPETRRSPEHKAMIQTELRNNLLSIIRLRNLKLKFKAAAILYSI